MSKAAVAVLHGETVNGVIHFKQVTFSYLFEELEGVSKNIF